MQVHDRVGVDSAVRAGVPRVATLGDLVQWCASQTPRAEIVEVVVQDEYTHDVVLAWRDGLYLVFDST